MSEIGLVTQQICQGRNELTEHYLTWAPDTLLSRWKSWWSSYELSNWWAWTLIPNGITRLELTHWGQVTHICVGNLTIIGSNNGLLPGRRQAIICTNAGILLIGPLGTNFSEILAKIMTFSFNIFIQENVFESVVCEMAAILSRPQCVNWFSKVLRKWLSITYFIHLNASFSNHILQKCIRKCHWQNVSHFIQGLYSQNRHCLPCMRIPIINLGSVVLTIEAF